MEQVYAKKLWGGVEFDFYSGAGSHDPTIVAPYIAAITDFLTSFEQPLVVCDLGCGDFNIGKQLVPRTEQYIAADIVPALIARNREKYKEEKVVFRCLDIAVDDLPAGDCVLLRQVLQHISNEEVQAVVRKLYDFKYVIVTEHVPEGDFVPNKDVISGQGIRLKKESGINLVAPPFDFEVKEQKILLSVVPKEHSGVIVTTMYTVF